MTWKYKHLCLALILSFDSHHWTNPDGIQRFIRTSSLLVPEPTAKPPPAECVWPPSMFACSVLLGSFFFFLSLSFVSFLSACWRLVLPVCCLVVPSAPAPRAQSALSHSFNSSAAPLSRSLYGSCREVHGSQGSLLVFNACRAAGLRVSTFNAKDLAPPPPKSPIPNPTPHRTPPRPR